jgi:hypothetical protein
MTSYRLDRYRNGKFIGSEVVDGIERADVALRLLLSNCATKHCRLYADDVLLAEGAEGSWWLPSDDADNVAPTADREDVVAAQRLSAVRGNLPPQLLS